VCHRQFAVVIGAQYPLYHTAAVLHQSLLGAISTDPCVDHSLEGVHGSQCIVTRVYPRQLRLE